MQEVVLFWFRRDLRLNDNHGLWQALNQPVPVLPVFIFDTNILNDLPDKNDPRVMFIHNVLSQLRVNLHESGSTLIVSSGKPVEAFSTIIKQFTVKAVYCNHDYEPYAIARDLEVAAYLYSHGITFHSFKDQVVLEKSEVLKDNGMPYTVFTPYSRKWMSKVNFPLQQFPSEKCTENFYRCKPVPLPSLNEIGFNSFSFSFPENVVNNSIIVNYQATRDFPELKGTSKLGIHLRFGTISIRELANRASTLNQVFLNELIWREFFMMILWHFPLSAQRSFKSKYDNIEWRNNESEFEAWKQGNTGYPIVDAGMRELFHTGIMHNRVRMITASFLVKHLLIDWRWGEAWFAQKLLDFDLSANVGNWQWASGSGCDAAPYFRVFSPMLQTQKFDKKLNYIRKWVPEFDSLTYPKPIVEHSFARNRVLAAYNKALS